MTFALEMIDVSVNLGRNGQRLNIVDRVNISLRPGETLGIVGESGCGKSVMASTVAGITPGNLEVTGQILLDGKDLLKMSEGEMTDIRGKRVGMIFQDPFSWLNPVMTVGDHLVDVLVRHENISRRAAKMRAVELLDLVRIAEPQRRVGDYPHEFSGGMCQRVAVACAIATQPALLIADEPTTALDVTIQAQILDLIVSLQDEHNIALMLISHDLGLIAEAADRVAVMYRGRKVEEQPITGIFENPLHPYTRALIRTRPELWKFDEYLGEIPGMVPALEERVVGCSFANRCEMARPECGRQIPALRQIGAADVACLYA